MASNRASSAILVTALGLLSLPAAAVAPVHPELEVRRQVVDPSVARPGTLDNPIFRRGLATRVFKTGASDTELEPLVRQFVLSDRAALGGMDAAPSTLAPFSIRHYGDGMTYVDYHQTYKGLEIVDSFIGLRFKNGRHVLTTSKVYPDVSVDVRPRLAAAKADAFAIQSLSGAGVSGLTVEKAAELVIYPVLDGASVTYHLAWRDRVKSERPAGSWETIVAADGSNEILYRHNKVAYGVGEFQVQIEPRYIGQTPVAFPARNVQIGSAVTDGDGQWETAAGTMNVANVGPYFSLDDQAQNAKSKSINVTGSGAEQFTWMSTEAPLEELDPFFYANESRERQIFVAPDIAWFYQVLPIHTNVSGTCNAYYDGQSLNFFPSDSQCNATSRIADVIFHEYGHGIHDHVAPSGIESTIQEGVADIFAHEITNDPNLGPYFFPNTLQGIRNAEEVRTYPTGVQGNYSEVHESGKIWTNTFWDIRKEFLRKQGNQIGWWAFNLFHVNTLRGDPSYTTAYQEAIAADDDDGNPANGTPNSCEINKIMQDHGLLMGTAAPVRGFLSLSHTLSSRVQAAGQDVPVSVSIDSLSPTCGDLDVSSVTLHYKVNGGAEQTVTLSGTAPTFSGAIPAQPAKSVVEYWFSAKETAQGAQFTAPLGAPTNVYTIYVGSLGSVWSDDFEADKGWTHGGDVASHDDWERGTPAGDFFDPASAHSGSNVIGNDLGLASKNGLYEPGVSNWIESPAIDCSACKGARLQFWRSLDVAAGDVATVKVNDQVVWTSETTGRLDPEWTFVDLDVSSIADGNSAVKVRFELTTDSKIQRSGWTIDDVSMLAEQGGTTPGNPGNPGAPGVGDSLNGGCKCTVAATAGRGPDASVLASLVGAALAMGAVLRRRRES